MKYLKAFNEHSGKDVFIEYKLEWLSKEGPDEMTHERLTAILKYIRTINIKEYKISGMTKDGEWKLIMRIGKK